jgi:endonuclease/exonuclease/phosphatase family metal-dependent hydrolase
VIKRLFYILNIIALVGLVSSCLACYISPVIFWPLSFLGLAFPIVVIVVFIFLLIWAIARHKLFWVNLTAIALSWPFIRTVVSVHPTTGEEKGIRIMSYNVKNFDLYNWSGNKQTRSKMMTLIRQENPDIMCFQEYYSDDDEYRNTDYIKDSLGYKYHYIRTTYDKWFKNTEKMKWQHLQWGIAIFSRFPIADTGLVSFGNVSGNQCMYADIKVEGKLLRVYNTHLQSIHLGYDDYDTIEELSENQSTNWRRLKNILRKMKRATAKRTAQARIMHDNISECKESKVVCGDFNDAPVSYTYQIISSGMRDAFVEKGRGFGKSFATKLGIYRIDYVLTDPSIRINSCRNINRELSDHYPLMVTISL